MSNRERQRRSSLPVISAAGESKCHASVEQISFLRGVQAAHSGFSGVAKSSILKNVCYDSGRFGRMRARTLITCFCFVGVLLSAQSAELQGIAHVAFRVSNLDRTRQFYEKLGFEQAFEFRDEQGRPAQSFIKINDHQFIELYSRTQDSQPLGVTHVCYETRDIESIRSAYVKAGLNPPEVKKARAGNLLLVLHDPDGQLVEYTQYLPGSLHWQDRGKHLASLWVADHLEQVTLSVRYPEAEFAFYSEKLGFTTAHGGSHTAVQIGNDELKFAPATGNTTGKIAFGVPSQKEAYSVLEKRGLAPKMLDGMAQITDPDGNVTVFVEVPQHDKR